jgi:hypothetical protein
MLEKRNPLHMVIRPQRLMAAVTAQYTGQIQALAAIKHSIGRRFQALGFQLIAGMPHSIALITALGAAQMLGWVIWERRPEAV